MMDWEEVKPNRFQRRIGNVIEIFEDYIAPNCILLKIYEPVRVREHSRIVLNTLEHDKHEYIIYRSERDHVGECITSAKALYEEHEKLPSLDVIELYKLLYV